MLKVRELMTADPCTVTPDTRLQEVISTMNTLGCRQLPVLQDGKLVGIITERDVRLAVDSPLLTDDLVQRKAMLEQHSASKCMTLSPMTVTPDTPAAEAAQMLSLYKFGALPVVASEEEDQLVGIITVTDFLNHIAAQGEGEAS